MPATISKRGRAKLVGRPLGAGDRPGPYAPPTTRKVLVATDGSRPAAAAIKLARAMEARGDWSPTVIAVLEPLPVAVGEVVLPMPAPPHETALNDSMLDGIKAQLRRYGDALWRLKTEFGSPAREIVQAAADERAELIVVGLGRHGRLARLLGAETAVRVARRSPVPVFAVSPRTWSARNIALVAVDFGDASLHAAREALALLEPPGRLHLVHVKPAHNMTSFADSEWQRAYAAATEEEFTRFRDKLGKRPGIDISTALATGDVVEKILAEARHVQAQLIALGTHSHPVLERMMIGDTPTSLLRASSCSVLIAPPGHAVP